MSRRSLRRGVRRGALGATLLLLGLAGLWPDAPAGCVDWRQARAVVLESDDWGLCGFLPNAAALAGEERSALQAGRFPAAYWSSTLEDSGAVSALAGVLARHRGRDGQPPLLQANMIVSALAWRIDASGQAGWRRHDIPDLPAAYARPGLWTAVDAAIAAGVWRPELHGAFHYDPARRQAAAAAGGPGRWAAERGIVVFPGSATAWELGSWRATAELAAELDRSRSIFAARFGRPPAAVCAPDYVWDARCEDLWESRHIRVIQAKREQRDPRRGWAGGLARVRKVVARAWDKWSHPGRVYLDRNCRFEPAQAENPEETVRACLRDVRRAWARGEPAIIETHRVNYAGLDSAATAAGRRLLDELLTALESEPGGAPIYLSDAELASLLREGTSAVRRGPKVLVRNLTHTARLVRLSGDARPVAKAQAADAGWRGRTEAVTVVAVPAGVSRQAGR